MSEEKDINIVEGISICNAIAKAQRELIERKAKLGENVVIADKNGQPLIISAKDALHLYTGKAK